MAGNTEPCPFCGADEPVYIDAVQPRINNRHWYECGRCKARGPYIAVTSREDDPQMQALAQWNLRSEARP